MLPRPQARGGATAIDRAHDRSLVDSLTQLTESGALSSNSSDSSVPNRHGKIAAKAVSGQIQKWIVAWSR